MQFWTRKNVASTKLDRVASLLSRVIYTHAVYRTCGSSRIVRIRGTCALTARNTQTSTLFCPNLRFSRTNGRRILETAWEKATRLSPSQTQRISYLPSSSSRVNHKTPGIQNIILTNACWRNGNAPVCLPISPVMLVRVQHRLFLFFFFFISPSFIPPSSFLSFLQRSRDPSLDRL